MRITEKGENIKPLRAKVKKRKVSEKLDKPLSKPDIPLEDSISKYKGLSRENYGVNVIL